MSLNQLTANYTDSEGDEDETERPTSNISSEDAIPSESKEQETSKDTPASLGSRGSMGAGTPQKKFLNRLVSYANEEEEEDDEDVIEKEDIEDQDENLNSEAMDTGTEDGDDDKSSEREINLRLLPAAPTGKCSQHLQDKISKHLLKVEESNYDSNAIIQNNKDYRNPSIYEKLIVHLEIDEMGSNYPLDMFDAHNWGKESFYDELAKTQKEEMDRREKERKEKTKVDVISGTKKPFEEEKKQRKSRFDQGVVPCGSVAPIKQPVPPPLLTSVATGNKPAISAFGSLMKNK